MFSLLLVSTAGVTFVDHFQWDKKVVVQDNRRVMPLPSTLPRLHMVKIMNVNVAVLCVHVRMQMMTGYLASTW